MKIHRHWALPPPPLPPPPKKTKNPEFVDLVSFQNCLFMHRLQQDEQLSKSFSGLIYINNKHNSNTRSANANILDIPQSNAAKYGTFSCKSQCIKCWNHFIKAFRNVKLSGLTYENAKLFSQNNFKILISKNQSDKFLPYSGI